MRDWDLLNSRKLSWHRPVDRRACAVLPLPSLRLDQGCLRPTTQSAAFATPLAATAATEAARLILQLPAALVQPLQKQ